MPNLFSFTTQQHYQWMAACKLLKSLHHIRNSYERRLGTPLKRKKSRNMLLEADTWQRWRSHHESSDWLGRWSSRLLCSWGGSLLRGGISSHQTSCQVGKIMEMWIRMGIKVRNKKVEGRENMSKQGGGKKTKGSEEPTWLLPVATYMLRYRGLMDADHFLWVVKACTCKENNVSFGLLRSNTQLKL